MYISQEDRTYTIAIINFFWPNQNVTSSQVTEALVIFAAEALDSANTCSDNMDLVPRPTGFRPDIKWALKQVRKIGQRFLEQNPGVYWVCKNRVAYSQKHFLDMALGGY